MGDIKSVSRMIKSYLETLNKRAIFIKKQDVSTISLEQICRDSLSQNGAKMFYYEYTLYKMKAAFDPFMSWIREAYYAYYADKYSVEEFVENCGVYSLQRGVFSSYIETGICERKIEVMLNEYEYEEERILESVYSSLKFISQDKPLVLVISKIHLAPLCVLKFLNLILGRTDSIRFIFTYGESFLVKEPCTSQWELLIQKAEEEKMFLITEKSDIVYNQDFPDKFSYDENEIEEYIMTLNNMVHLFALEDAKYYLDNILKHCSRIDSNVNNSDKFKLLEMLVMVCFGLGEYKDALLVCEKLAQIANNESDVYQEYIYNYFSAKAHLFMRDPKLTHKFCRRSRELAEKLNDDLLLMNVDIVETLVEFGSLKDLFKCNYSYQIKESVLERAKKIGNENFLAYMYVFGFDNDLDNVKAIGRGEKEPVYFNKGTEIAAKLGNKNLLLNAYLKNIILYSDCGCYKYVRLMYEKREQLIDKDKPVRLGHLYAGFGYNEIILENYVKADEYFHKSISLLIENQKVEDIAETLYNMFMNDYLMGQNEKVVETIELTLKIMKLIHIQSLRICNTSKIYGILSLAHFKLGQYIDSCYCVDKMETILSYVRSKTDERDEELWTEDLFLYHLIKANFSTYENDVEKAQKHFELAEKYMHRNEGCKYYTYAEYAMFKAAFLEKFGFEEERKKVLTEAYEYCINHDLPLKADMLKAEISRTPKMLSDLYQIREIPAKKIIDVASYVGAGIELEKRKKEIYFMTISQNIMGNEDTNTCTVINQTMNLIRNSFSFDKIIFLEKKEEGIFSTFVTENANINDETAASIFDFFDTYKVEFVASRFEKSFKRYSSVIEKVGGNEVAAIFGIPVYNEGRLKRIFLATIDVHKNFTEKRNMLDAGDLNVIKCVICQLDEAISRINSNLVIRIMNAKLEKAAYIDQLTGIYNRMGFQKILSDDIAENGAVLYMDLDNFKKYNDSYGHNIGDEILKMFAHIIDDSVGQIGYAIRYGGDEFVAVLPDKSENFAREIAYKIQELLIDNSQYSDFYGKEKFTSSVGIAKYESKELADFERALKKADKALYYVKDHQKGNVAIWSEIEDQIS